MKFESYKRSGESYNRIVYNVFGYVWTVLHIYMYMFFNEHAFLISYTENEYFSNNSDL